MEFPLESSGIPLESSGIPQESSGISTESSGISTDPVEFPLESSGNSSGITLFQKSAFYSTRIPVEFHQDSSGIPLIFLVGFIPVRCRKPVKEI